MECNFHVGQKVVCINADRSPPGHIVFLSEPVGPVKGQVYTIREVEIGIETKSVCIRLVEIADQTVEIVKNGKILEGDITFQASCFRPVSERKTDISIFKAMLNPSKVEEPA